MKILHVISSVNPLGGGPIEGVRQLSSVYMEAGMEVEVCSLDAPDAPFLRDFPLPTHGLGPGTIGTYSYSNRMLQWLRQNHSKYDCVIVNGLWQYHGFACWQALRNTETPYVVFTHGMLDPWFKKRYPLKHMKKWMYWPWGEYRILRDAKAVLFTSEEEKVLAAQSFWLYKANGVVVGYGTQRPGYDLEQARQRFLDEFAHLRGKRIATFVGRIHPKKGCDLLIRAFAQTLAQDPEWHLVIVGPDQVGWQADLVRLSTELGIADRITWTGMLQGERKWGALAAMEVFVLPSHQENFGIVVAEALACGKPALISHQINIWREVKQEQAGLVAADTLEGTVELLQAWREMPVADRSRMSDRARACFDRHFDLHSSSSVLLELLSKIAQERYSRVRS